MTVVLQLAAATAYIVLVVALIGGGFGMTLNDGPLAVIGGVLLAVLGLFVLLLGLALLNTQAAFGGIPVA